MAMAMAMAMATAMAITKTIHKAIFTDMSDDFFLSVQSKIEGYGFTVADKDFTRPWGGFLVIDESQAQAFSDKFFSGMNVNSLRIEGKLSPKILIVAPEQRLSWQYHHRRAEIWQVFKGEVGIIRSDDDEEGKVVTYSEGAQVKIAQGERHRLIGLRDYGIVAEIWQHTEVTPSDESDIVRVQDDFNRE